MIDPIASLRQILLNEPERAREMLDILTWAEIQPRLADSNRFDEMKTICYAELQDCREKRDAYCRSRAA